MAKAQNKEGILPVATYLLYSVAKVYSIELDGLVYFYFCGVLIELSLRVYSIGI